ncbi:MAG TPA: PAS domain S-box protein [Methanolinea sp.]|nr:PAS domain S-box protein [Methanolinea sp.]HQK55287.1 PAS domain S-box protein [Methanolinea sp.]
MILVVTVLALQSGLTIIFQNAYYIPIILSCYYFQRKGLFFSIGIIFVYFTLLAWTFPFPDVILQGVIRVLFFLFIALLVTYLSETIQKEKSRYKGIFSASESAIMLYRKDNLAVIEANPRCQEITGYTPDELCSLTITAIFRDGEDMMPFFKGSERYFVHQEAALRHKDGTTRIVLFTTGSAEPGIGTVTIQDITDRKRAEEAIKASEEKFRMLFEHSGDPIMILGIDGAIIDVNSTAETHLGYSREDLYRMNIRDIEIPEHSALMEGQIQEMKMSGSTLFETAHRTRSGDVVPIEVHATLISYHGNPAVLSIRRDISERKRTEVALQQANRKLNLLNSITRHDILNSLTALMGYLELSKEEVQDPRMREYIEIEMRAAESIKRQIDFTRDYQNVGVKSPAWFSVPLMIRQMRDRIQNARIQIEIDLPDVEIFADPLIEKVFYNLMENAVRHGGKITRIWFTCEGRDGNLVISCCDDGAGVPVDKKEAIFNREYFQHSGFGLFLSREILGITDIHIQETGTPGEGARFELVIPPGAFRYPGRPGTTRRETDRT